MDLCHFPGKFSSLARDISRACGFSLDQREVMLIRQLHSPLPTHTLHCHSNMLIKDFRALKHQTNIKTELKEQTLCLKVMTPTGMDKKENIQIISFTSVSTNFRLIGYNINNSSFVLHINNTMKTSVDRCCRCARDF